MVARRLVLGVTARRAIRNTCYKMLKWDRGAQDDAEVWGGKKFNMVIKDHLRIIFKEDKNRKVMV